MFIQAINAEDLRHTIIITIITTASYKTFTKCNCNNLTGCLVLDIKWLLDTPTMVHEQ
jgi:hypothetical protein